MREARKRRSDGHSLLLAAGASEHKALSWFGPESLFVRVGPRRYWSAGELLIGCRREPDENLEARVRSVG